MDLIAPQTSTFASAFPVRWRGPVPLAEAGGDEGAGASGAGGATTTTTSTTTESAEPATGPSLKERLAADMAKRREQAEQQRQADAAEKKALLDRIEALEKGISEAKTRETERAAAAAKAERDAKVSALLDAAKVKARFRGLALGELGELGDPTSAEAKKKIDDWASKNADMVEQAKVGPLSTPPAGARTTAQPGRPRGADFMPVDMAAHRGRR